MTSPWMTKQMGAAHQRELFETQRARRLARAARGPTLTSRPGWGRRALGVPPALALSASGRPAWRERLGWRLVDLGIHLVMHPERSAQRPNPW